ncbi:MAG TPA: hypothetical protein VIL01_14480 [Thermomicrobiales bacterium]
MARLGLSPEELQAAIEQRLRQLDDAQAEEEHLGPFSDLLRTVAQIAYQRAADLILLNNRRLQQQLTSAGITIPGVGEDDGAGQETNERQQAESQ